MEFNNIYKDLISGKEKLALVGLGYVGMPIAVEFAKHINVIGFDINEKRINEYKNGIDSTNEVGEAIKDTKVEFTADPSKLKEAKFIVVAVPTPVNEDNTPDLRPVEGASRTVGQNLSAGTIVVFESTVYPVLQKISAFRLLRRNPDLSAELIGRSDTVLKESIQAIEYIHLPIYVKSYPEWMKNPAMRLRRYMTL